MLNISIPNINAEYLVLALDHASLPAGRQGFALSTRSACNEGDASSHVVLRLAEASLCPPKLYAKDGAKAARSPIVEWRAKNTLRISLGRDTTKNNLISFAKNLSTGTAALHFLRMVL